jgi:hypothetical protein
VKLLHRSESAFTFRIGKREREVFLGLLRRYPVLKTAHFRSRGGAKSEAARSNQELLEEALAEQQRENRRNLEEMLAQPGRFQESELGYNFTLSGSELEWLLQVLNDIRVGSWVQLGEPDTNLAGVPDINEKNIEVAWAIEIAGRFEQTLLDAADA